MVTFWHNFDYLFFFNYFFTIKFTEKGEFSEKGTNELTETLGKINPHHIKIETTDFAEVVILGCGGIEEKAE